MSIYITPQDELHVDYQGIALTCPHCQTLTHLTPIAVPKFEELSRRRPKHIGIVFRCDTCIEPIFLKFAVKAYTALRVELASNFIEIERPREHFPLTYLPEEAEGSVQRGAQLLLGGLFQCIRLDEPAHGAVVVSRTGRARQVGTVRHPAGDPLARGPRRRHLFDPARGAVRQRQRSLAESAELKLGTRRDSAGSHARPAVSDLCAQGTLDTSGHVPPIRRASTGEAGQAPAQA